MRNLLMLFLILMLGYPLLAETECDKAKLFVMKYKANIDYHLNHVYTNPILQYLQRRLKLRMRNLEDSLDNPSIYELNCQRILERVRLRIQQMQSIKDILPKAPSPAPTKKEEPAKIAPPPANEPAKEEAHADVAPKK